MSKGSRTLDTGDRVEIKTGDERGGWAIVKLIENGRYHVAMYGASVADRVFTRQELRKTQ